MAVQVHCPHCRSLCQVNEQYFGMSVRCGKCSQPFVVRGPAAPNVSQPPGSNAPGSPQPPGSNAPGSPASWTDKVRGVFQSMMPFSKVEETVQEEYVLSEDNGPTDVPDAEVMESDSESKMFAFSESSPPRVCRFDIGSATSVGLVSNRNEDSFLVQQINWSNLDQRREAALVVVADGMGGHGAGDRASHLVIQSVGSSLASLLAGALNGQVKDMAPSALEQTVLQAVKSANQKVYQHAQNDSSCHGMGATAAVVLFWEGQAVIVHVGDCRVYGYRAGKLTQITRDQTLVERMVALGQLTPQEALHHPARNRVAQGIGKKPEVEPDIHRWQPAPGDWLIVACDGLHAHVDAPTLEKTIRSASPSAAALAQQLVEMADAGGGSDNCTVTAIRCF